jgi:3D (Asp-Asp-Asp) domain-containing protein
MQHNNRHRQIDRIKKKYKTLAAAVAGAAILSSISLPGMPSATALAAANPNKDNEAPPATTSQQVKTQAANAPKEFKQVVNATATAYAPGALDNDQWGNKTYLGTNVRPGIIAVDPDVIPIGSRLYIQYPDGHGEYAVAEDTGGAIKGNRIDVAKSTVKEAENFGMKQVKVFVVESPEKA